MLLTRYPQQKGKAFTMIMSTCATMWYWFRVAELRNDKEVQPLGFSSHPGLLKCLPGRDLCSRMFEVNTVEITAFKKYYNHLFCQGCHVSVCPYKLACACVRLYDLSCHWRHRAVKA